MYCTEGLCATTRTYVYSPTADSYSPTAIYGRNTQKMLTQMTAPGNTKPMKRGMALV